jgi:hypothetical protein
MAIIDHFKMMLTTYRCRVNIYTIGEAYHTQARPPLVYDHTVGTGDQRQAPGVHPRMRKPSR